MHTLSKKTLANRLNAKKSTGPRERDQRSTSAIASREPDGSAGRGNTAVRGAQRPSRGLGSADGARAEGRAEPRARDRERRSPIAL